MREGKTHLGLQSEKQCGRGERDWKYNKEMGYNHYKDFNFRVATEASKESIETAQSKCVKPEKEGSVRVGVIAVSHWRPSAFQDGGFHLSCVCCVF